jgi:hypothetical protein
VAELVAGLALERGTSIAYRDEVRHPALEQPEIASGTMRITKGGTLIRDQAVPRRQVIEIGDELVSVRTGPDAEPSLYPLPAEIRPMIAAIRALLTGDAAAIEAAFSAEMSIGDSGWRLTLRPISEQPLSAVAFSGCGGVLKQMEISESHGIRRLLSFSAAR